MIEGFEKETKKLSEVEKAVLLPAFVKALAKKVGKDKIITSDEMIKGINQSYGVKMTGARVRKIINYIRTNSMLPGLIANGRGYYITNDPTEMMKYVKSLKQREGAIRAVRENAEIYLTKISNEKNKA